MNASDSRAPHLPSDAMVDNWWVTNGHDWIFNTKFHHFVIGLVNHSSHFGRWKMVKVRVLGTLCIPKGLFQGNPAWWKTSRRTLEDELKSIREIVSNGHLYRPILMGWSSMFAVKSFKAHKWNPNDCRFDWKGHFIECSSPEIDDKQVPGMQYASIESHSGVHFRVFVEPTVNSSRFGWQSDGVCWIHDVKRHLQPLLETLWYQLRKQTVYFDFSF